MNDIKKDALAFEARKIAITQDRNGIVLKLSIHPNECPADLFMSHLGTRYMVGLAVIGDDAKPQAPPIKKEVDGLIARAGMLPKNERFQAWMARTGLSKTTEIEDVTIGIREAIGVTSRAEMATNSEARVLFIELVREFEDAMREGKA